MASAGELPGYFRQPPEFEVCNAVRSLPHPICRQSGPSIEALPVPEESEKLSWILTSRLFRRAIRNDLTDDESEFPRALFVNGGEISRNLLSDLSGCCPLSSALQADYEPDALLRVVSMPHRSMEDPAFAIGQ